MTKQKRIEEMLQDCHIAPGDPDRRTALAADVAKFASPDDVELVCRYTEARADNLNQAPRLIAHSMRNAEAFTDVLHLAKRWEKHKPGGKAEPGEDIRKDNMREEASVTKRDRYRMELAAYQMMSAQEVTSKEALARRLVDHFPGMEAMSLMEQMPDLLEAGAKLYNHPCPKLAAFLLSKGDVRSNTLWLIWHRRGGLQDSSRQAVAEKAEQLRLSHGWALEDEEEPAKAV